MSWSVCGIRFDLLTCRTCVCGCVCVCVCMCVCVCVCVCACVCVVFLIYSCYYFSLTFFFKHCLVLRRKLRSPCLLSRDVAVYVFDIQQPSLPTPFYSVLVSVSVCMALSSIFHSINYPNNSPLPHSVLPVLALPYWSFQREREREKKYIYKSPSFLI